MGESVKVAGAAAVRVLSVTDEHRTSIATRA
jgi:hypothetical protein